MVDKPHKPNDDDENDEKASPLADGLKKLFAAGVSAAFMTEESIRSYLAEMKLPKEVLQYILQNASKSKEQLMNRASQEVVNIISKIDFVKEASKFVENHKFRINAEIEVVKKDDGVSHFKTKVHLKDEN